MVVDLPHELKPELTAFLARNKVVFAWSQQEVRGISLKVMEHRLNVYPEARLVRQKKRYFGQKKNKIISAEVTRIYFGNPISNLVS